MKTRIPLLIALLISVTALGAPREYLVYSLQDRQERVAELNDEILRLDTKIEQKLEKLEVRLRQSQDSADSGITVQMAKESLIEGLAKLAQYYKEQRDLLLKEAQSNMPRADPETLNFIAKAYDERIDKRINQIIALNNSASTSRPNATKGTDKQLARRSLEQQKAAREALEGIINNLQLENTRLRSQLNGLSDTDTDMIREAIQTNEQQILRRESQLAKLDEGTPTPARKLTKSEALELRKMLEAAGTDIKEDCYRLSNLVIEYVKEEQAVNSLKAELDKLPPAPEDK